ncbi:MAG: nucleotide exchange factor GrpE [Verrucomicrobia bacterium]|jgi:molecular chaperone GrpE|nr:nucleotide exchange factor GrpE [Verrucomicrobiota bacterium]
MKTPKANEDKNKAENAPAEKAAKKKGSARSKKKTPKATPEKKEAALPPVDDRYLRLQADFDNYRKRVLREKDELYRRANEDIMEELLPVLDHLDLALGSFGEAHAHDPVVEGFRLVGEQLASVLARFGLAPIETEAQEFDPNLHEAILHMPSADVAENIIVSQARGGYKLGEKLLRASQVVVSSGPAEQSESDVPEEPEA